MLQAPDRANPAQIVDDFDRVVTQRGDEQIAASPVVTEVIDPPQNAGENDARPESERYRSLVCTRTRITAGVPNSNDKAKEQRCQCKTDNELDAEDRVQSISYCRNTYKVMTADGKTRDFWERNLRFKTDSGAEGPEKGAPALLGAGMLGDRADVIFAGPGEISGLIVARC